MIVLRKNPVLLFGLAISGICISGICVASTPSELAAVSSCARGEAHLLHARVSATRDELDFPDWWTSAPDLAQQPQQMVVVARDGSGREIARMLCSYDDHDRVVSIHPILNVVAALDLDR